MVGGKEVGGDTKRGTLAVSEIRLIPIQVIAPAEEAGGKADGQLTLTAAIGGTTHHDTFTFRIFGDDPPGKGEIAVVDTDGTAGKMLADLGYATRAWDGKAAELVVVGRNALKENTEAAGKLEAFVRAGGRAVILRKTRNGWNGPSAGGCARKSAGGSSLWILRSHAGSTLTTCATGPATAH